MARVREKVLLGLILTYLVGCTAVDLSTTIIRVSDGQAVNISLSTYNKTSDEDQVFKQLANINGDANFVINVQNIPEEVSFIIIQIHAHLYNVSMSYNKEGFTRAPGNFVTGTNIGLFVDTDSANTAVVYVSNESTFAVDSLIAVVAYTIGASYPGGCNMEFDIEKSPFQKLSYDEATITVDAQPASIPKIGNFQPPCEKYPLKYDAYRMYMPEQDFSNETYFEAISNMLTVRDIQSNADLIPASYSGSAMRRVYSLYLGTGSVYCMVARFANRTSAYIPIVTYGCDPTSADSCSILTTNLSKVICALTLFLGLFISSRGHYYFKTSMFLIGTLVGGFIGYAVSSFYNPSSVTANLGIAVGSGILASTIWLFLWIFISSPLPSLILSGLTLGAFYFYVFYFTIPAGTLYLEYDTYYWLIFSIFVTLTILILSVIPLVGNILCFTVVGAYASVIALDYYCGTNLKYIMINGMRRATVSNFNIAVIDPPFQDHDSLLIILWIIFVACSIYKQCKTNWNRAPFPPSPSNLMGDERTPLLR